MNSVHSKELEEYIGKKGQLKSRKRKTMDDFLLPTAKKPKTAAGSMGLKKLKTLCLNWISKNNRPIKIVEDDGLIELSDYANEMKNAVELPGRICLSESIRETADIKRMAWLKPRTTDSKFAMPIRIEDVS